MPPESSADYTPSLQDMARRLGRVEDRLDARMLTIDVYQAEKAAVIVEIASLRRDMEEVKESISAATRLVLGAFLGIIVNAVFLAITIFGGKGP